MFNDDDHIINLNKQTKILPSFIPSFFLKKSIAMPEKIIFIDVVRAVSFIH